MWMLVNTTIFAEMSELEVMLDTMISTYTPTRHFEQIMRGFCLKKIYPGITILTAFYKTIIICWDHLFCM